MNEPLQGKNKMVDTTGIVTGKRAELAKRIGHLTAALEKNIDRRARTRGAHEVAKLDKKIRGQRQEISVLQGRLNRMPAGD
jgi:hypothetical protein